MLLIPEIETVVILVPRTATTSTINAVKERYPRAIQLYRHMEADGVPEGYRNWACVGVVRAPLDRLWSLFKFMRDFSGWRSPEYGTVMRASAQMSFDTWLTSNDIVFATPHDFSRPGHLQARSSVLHPLPENRKSQFIYLRPDLGTEVYRYDELSRFADRLGISLLSSNESGGSAIAADISTSTLNKLIRLMPWDFNHG